MRSRESTGQISLLIRNTIIRDKTNMRDFVLGDYLSNNMSLK